MDWRTTALTMNDQGMKEKKKKKLRDFFSIKEFLMTKLEVDKNLRQIYQQSSYVR